MTSEGMSLKQQIALVIGNAKLIALVNSRFSPSIFADEILRLVAEEVERMPRDKDAHKYLNPADAAYAERISIVEQLKGEEK